MTFLYSALTICLLFLTAETRASDKGRLMFLIEKMVQHKGGFICEGFGFCPHPKETYECCPWTRNNEIACVLKGSDACEDIFVCTTLICNDECCMDNDNFCCDNGDWPYTNCAPNKYWCHPIDCQGDDDDDWQCPSNKRCGDDPYQCV